MLRRRFYLHVPHIRKNGISVSDKMMSLSNVILLIAVQRTRRILHTGLYDHGLYRFLSLRLKSSTFGRVAQERNLRR